jgi:hypothetical protein
MNRIAPILIALCLWVTPALAQTRTWIAGGSYNGYGAANPISGTDFLYPYIVNFPNCFQTALISAPIWDPNSVSLDYYVEATNGATCAGGGAPNPGQGIFVKLNQPHRAIGIVQLIALTGNITSNVFINRLNDCTHQATTGVYRGCIDYAAQEIGTDNKIISDVTGSGSKSVALPTDGSFHQNEWCYISGTNGSGTVPSKESAWLDGTQYVNNATPGTSAPNIGGGNGVTVPDYELGGGGSLRQGLWAVYDSGAACPASALGTMYGATAQPIGNGSHIDFTPNANANWQNAAAATPGSASYNADATAGAYDIYNMNLGTFSNILFVTQRASVEKTAPGTRIAQLGWNISGTNYQCPWGNGYSLGGDTLGTYIANNLQIGTYQQIGCVSPTDPSTSSAWGSSANASHVTATVIR